MLAASSIRLHRLQRGAEDLTSFGLMSLPCSWVNVVTSEPSIETKGLDLPAGEEAAGGDLNLSFASLETSGSNLAKSQGILLQLQNIHGEVILPEITMCNLTVRLVLLVTALMVAAQNCGGTLTLQRAFPPNESMVAIVTRDHRRVGRMVGNFPLSGGIDIGLYYATVALGSPPQRLNVQIDTGSDIPWVGCINCIGCPESTAINITLSDFDPAKSTTAAPLHCSGDQLCNFWANYGDGSRASGYYVSDVLTLESAAKKNVSSAIAGPLIFGCTTNRLDNIAVGNSFVDGIFGFGPGEESVVRQLSKQGFSPNVFSLCLDGGKDGGGVLVMAKAVHPQMVYTPLIPSQPLHTIKMEGITVNGKLLPVTSAFSAGNAIEGIAVDSGTTLTYLESEIYEPLISAIHKHLPKQTKPYSSSGYLCYNVTVSEIKLFPLVTLHFAAGASMVVRPEEYLRTIKVYNGSHHTCMGFQRVLFGGIPILGDLVLRDKIIVFDLYGKRIGWSSKKYNCSSQLNVNSSYGYTKNSVEVPSPRLGLLVAAAVSMCFHLIIPILV